MIRLAVIACIALAGCYDPAFRADIQCSESGACPDDMVCGVDRVCRSVGLPSDAAPDTPPDAMPVACEGDTDCATPPDPCQLAGVCDHGFCAFASKDCSSLDGECALGACNPVTGACEAEASNEGNSCGAGTSCNPIGSCDYSDTCDQDAQQMFDCTDNVCRSGACAAEPRQELQPCVRDTTATPCGGVSFSNCTACNPAECLRQCDCSTPICAGGTCSAVDVVRCERPCTPCTPV